MRAEGTDMCNSYTTWMRLDGNRNIQCKPNFFCPPSLRGLLIAWQGRPLRRHVSQSMNVLHLWLLKEVGHCTKGVLGVMRNTDILQNIVTNTKVQNALKQMYEE